MAADWSPEPVETASSAFGDFDPSIAAEFGYDIAESTTFLGVQLFNAQSLLHLALHFTFNLLVSWIMVHFFYYRKSGRKNYYFTFLMFSSAMFVVLFVMENIKMQIGFALGLFAIFGMIRYRTETVPVREMTYLFAIIALSIVNGLALNISYSELALANLLVIALTWILESCRIATHTSTKLVTYDRIDLIVPEKREELKADLEKRIGVKIKAIEIGSVDFLRDSAFIKITYSPDGNDTNDIDLLVKEKDYIG
ncbi:MAG: DUF4956 domain-containing protein [Bacteroidales bacterium]|nr:DUF4956 domain-containing protein [Bacteroidales bacterium]MDE6870857.1 DUF4956 domain-containing protein [Bacteroidales bacterium]MDE7127918.1 DUF4956 domain-containing protein [Bacteroidales bacterium]